MKTKLLGKLLSNPGTATVSKYPWFTHTWIKTENKMISTMFKIDEANKPLTRSDSALKNDYWQALLLGNHHLPCATHRYYFLGPLQSNMVLSTNDQNCYPCPYIHAEHPISKLNCFVGNHLVWCFCQKKKLPCPGKYGLYWKPPPWFVALPPIGWIFFELDLTMYLAPTETSTLGLLKRLKKLH